ncbi:MAG: cytochrome c [Deltaproteobacteria bacterium]|nr:cytochrome c [Deltaproteobacteria bacterium]
MRSRPRHLLVLFALLACACSGQPASAPSDARSTSPGSANPGSDPGAALEFLQGGRLVRRLTLAELHRLAPAESVTLQSPEYRRRKRYRALPLEPLLAFGFATPTASLARRDLELRASDGYTASLPAAVRAEGGAMLAVEDLDQPGWEPVGPRRATPGPFYLIWSRPSQRDTHRYPWVWQLVSFDLASHAELYRHTVPAGAKPGSAVARGHALFTRDCLRCHAMNREGGRLGPDLNVPQSIVEYRPAAQIRQYIKNPLLFRYGTMPAQAQLSEADLDALLAYFAAMKEQKHDPDAPTRTP